MKKYKIIDVMTEWVQQKYGPLTETFLANFGDMFELLAEDIPIPWPQYYFLLDQKLFIVSEKDDVRFAFVVSEFLSFLDKRYGPELKSRRIILKYLMDFWGDFCQYVADLLSQTKDPFPEPPKLVTFQEWLPTRIRFYADLTSPSAKLVREWVDVWNEILWFYAQQNRKMYKIIEPILTTRPELRKLGQWEMEKIFDELAWRKGEEEELKMEEEPERIYS